MRRVHARVLTITHRKQEVSIKSLSRVAAAREQLITHHSWNTPYRRAAMLVWKLL